MLGQIQDHIGCRSLQPALGLSVLTLRGWVSGRYVPDMAGRRVIWLVWCIVFHPERCRTLLDLATWGRFSTRERAALVLWSDWSI
jgi:hypothetical protein